MKKKAILGLIVIIVGLSTTVVLSEQLPTSVYVPFVVLEHSTENVGHTTLTPSPTPVMITPTPSPTPYIPNSGTTLRTVRSRGVLKCAANSGLTAFGFLDPNSNKIVGFDTDFCKVMAAAIFGEDGAENIQLIPTSGTTRFPILLSGDADVLIRNTTWTYSRDIDLGLEFGPITFYDGQGFMVRADLGIESLEDLDGGSVCVQTGTWSEKNLSDTITKMGLAVDVQSYPDNASTVFAYLDEQCDSFTTDKSGLVATRGAIDGSSDHFILDETISKEPLTPVVREGDINWIHVMRWSTLCTIQAEESGVSQRNVDEMLNSDDYTIQNLLGTGDVDYGEMMGLSSDFCYQIIKQVGNYADIYDRHLGTNSSVQLPRGINALWTEGGLLYAPPFR